MRSAPPPTDQQHDSGPLTDEDQSDKEQDTDLHEKYVQEKMSKVIGGDAIADPGAVTESRQELLKMVRKG